MSHSTVGDSQEIQGRSYCTSTSRMWKDGIESYRSTAIKEQENKRVDPILSLGMPRDPRIVAYVCCSLAASLEVGAPGLSADMVVARIDVLK